MRHKKANKHLSRATDQRLAILKSMSVALFRYGRIETTSIRAKELKRFSDKIITLVKKGDLQSKRKIVALLMHDRTLAKKICDAKDKFARKGGYSRIIRTGLRRGDGAQKVLIELVDAAV